MERFAKAISQRIIESLKENPRLNPLPYKSYETFLMRHIDNAKKKHGKDIGFAELSEAVKGELMKSGISVQPPVLSKEKELVPVDGEKNTNNGAGNDEFSAGANIGMVIGETVRNAGSAAVDAGVVVGKAAVDASVAVGKAAVDASVTVGKTALSIAKKAGALTAGAVAGTLVGLFRGSGKKEKKS
jgi:hypothetical protein